MPPGVRHVVADRWRPGAYEEVAREVAGEQWDGVIDVSWQPELVRSALAALADSATHWVYVSSISAYRDHSADGSDVLHDPWAGSGEASAEEYGPAKVACEQICAAAVPEDRLTIARVGLIAGYGDRSDRFGYWPARFDAATNGTPVLAPPATTPVQVIDVEDLASWLVTAIEHGTSGTYDTVGDLHGFDELAALCREATGQDPGVVAADQDWLLAHDVAPWAGPDSLPLWLPVPEYARMTTHDGSAAKHAGLRLRPLADTVAAALRWEREQGLGRSRRAGLSRERETALLAAWHAEHR